MQNEKSAIGLDVNATALIGYVTGAVALVSIFIEKDSKFVRFHAFQAVIYWAALFALATVCAIIIRMLGIFSHSLASLVSMLFGLLFLGIFAGLLFLAFKSFQGEMYKLPVIGDMAEKFTK